MRSLAGRPSAEQLGNGACPDLEPKQPALRIAATSLGGGRYRILVTAGVADMGANEADTDIEPVRHATLQLGGSTTYTDAQGTAVVTVSGGHHLTASAGDTLVAASLDLP